MNTENKSDDARTDQRDKYLRAIIDTTKDAFFVIGEDEKIVDYNQAFLKITGLSRKEAQQIHLYDIVPPSESLAKIKNAERLLNTGSVLFEGFIKKKDGSIVDVELTTTLYSDKPFIVVCFARDITERKNAAKSLQNMHDLMQYIVEHSRSSVAIFDNERRYMYVSQPYIDSFPLRGVDIIGGYHYDISPNVPQSIRDIHTRALNGEVTRCEEDKYINADGSVEWTCWECRPWYQNNGQIGGYVLYAEIITERKLMEQALYDEKEHFRTALLSVGDGVISTDRSGRVTAMNPVAEKLTGQASADVLYKPAESILALYHEDSGMPYGGYVKQVMESCTVVESPGPIYLVSAAGAETPVELSAAPIRSSGGETAGAVLVIRDFTEKRAKQKEIEYLSYNDYVTGLYNRRYMEEAFKRLDTKMNLPLTVMVIDVNGLKLTNDAFGHDKGDLLLKEVGDLLKKTCRSSDIVGRMGGDEFCILLPNTDEIHAAMISGRIKDAAAHVHLDPIIVSLAVGYAVKRSSRQDLKTVMTTADNLMYKDKIKHGRAARGQTIDMILSTINLNYSQEQIHTERVSQFCEKIACALKMSEKDIREIRTAGALHDIGKIMVPPQLLNKAESLTADEFDIIKRHPEIGYQMLKSVDEYASLSEDVLYHHERYDGSGYPEGLSGDNIPLYARIIAVADAFEAMTAKRPYQKTKTRAEAVAELRRGAGTQFDPELVEVFIRAVIGPADGD